MNSRNIYSLYEEYANGAYSKSNTAQMSRELDLKVSIFLRSLTPDEKRAVKNTLDEWISGGSGMKKAFALEIYSAKEMRS